MESAAGKTGQDKKWQFKLLGLSVTLQSTLGQASDATFYYPANYDNR